jgi:hypothetical protein
MTGSVISTYGVALRDEPKLRWYLGAAVIDDVGIAISAWALQILTTNLFTDQRSRAKLMLPTLLCFLVGSLIAGPLADWGARASLEGLGRWRWRLVLWARLVETAALGVAIWGVTSGAPSIGRLLPYFMISAFMKTALRPTRSAFEVDLLRREHPQVDAHGEEVRDERGAPRFYKVHLLSFEAMSSMLRSAALLAGLLLGGKILGAVGGRYAPLLVADVGTNLCFVATVFLACHPERSRSEVRLRDLFGKEPNAGPRDPAEQGSERRSIIVVGVLEFFRSFRDAVRFLRNPEQRPLVWLLFGAWVVEVVSEFYDGKMIVKHVLVRSDDTVRYSEITWVVSTMAAALLLPALARRVGSLGKIFLATMLLDGLVIACAGRLSIAGAATAAVPFVALLGADRGLTAVSSSLASLAQNSASSAGMRGRIAAAFALTVIVSDIVAEGAATGLAESLGIPRMLLWIGLAQVALMLLAGLAGGRRLWSFGLRSTSDRA